ncbi:MAG: NAD(P)-binding oxidoreductase [Pseudomonadota bacterium]
MKVLVLGASGATGRLLVDALLRAGVQVKGMVRPGSTYPLKSDDREGFSRIESSIAQMSARELAPMIANCDVVLSCLGHNLSFRGIFGHPRRLVTDAIRTVCQAIEINRTGRAVKVILMNTTGNANRDIPEKPPWSQRVAVGLIRTLLPPHADNEAATDCLRTQIGQAHARIEWAAVRPDGLIDEAVVSPYALLPSPTRNVIFDAGKTSRINVADFMARLVTEDALWQRWKGQMPVIYNAEYSEPVD